MPTHRAGRKHRASKHRNAMRHREDSYTETLVNIPKVAVSPYRLRVTKAPSNIPDSLEGAGGVATIDANELYIGFAFHSQMTDAFLLCRELGYTQTRIVDPYAIHVSMSKNQVASDIAEHFAQFGAVCSTVVHDKYAFVNFRSRSAALCALAAGKVHRIGEVNSKVRAKVLSRSDPFAPKGYSPARWS